MRRLLAVAAILSAVSVVALETSQAQSAPAWVAPRTPWGDPDLQGVWPGTAMMGVPIERPRQLGDRAILSDEEWTRPWTIAFPLTQEPGYGMFEYACHEGNYGLRNILSGSRADERRER